MKNFLQSVNERTLPTLKFLLFFVSIFIFPGMLTKAGIDRVLLLQNRLKAEEQQKFMSEKLRDLEKFSNNSFFAHFLLKKLCLKATKSESWQEELATGIAFLKNKYENSFSFVVAGPDNNIIEKLSDQKSYKFILKKSFKLFSQIRNSAGNDQSGSYWPNENDFRSLRPLLGDLIDLSQLHQPLRSLETGQSILASAEAEKYHIWFQAGKKFSMIVFINRSFIFSQHGLKWA